jgi:16S rRNA (guanine527-N7)-methyltransferase
MAKVWKQVAPMNDVMRDTLAAGLPALGLTLEGDVQEKLCAFARAMVKQNEVMNLTGITEDEPVAKLHLLDSLTVAACVDLTGKTLIDVGCGAGFPGVPLAIACPDAKVTLLDSLGKRMKWLEEILPSLGISAECITARAEEAVASRREVYDVATSRAVARLNILLELTAPYVKVGGFVVALKGSAAKEELAEAKNAIKKLGLSLVEVRDFVFDDATHGVIVLKKVAPTPAAYPRRFAKIKQNPL